MTTLGLHCCSKWFEQLSSRISKYLANGGFSSGPELVHGLSNDDGRSAYQFGGHRQLPFIHSAISLRHRSESRPICVSRESLHGGSLCHCWWSVCNYDRFNWCSNYAEFLICLRLLLSYARSSFSFEIIPFSFFPQTIMTDNVLFIAVYRSMWVQQYVDKSSQ